MRNKFVLTFLNFLLKEKLIEDYRFLGKRPDLDNPSGVKLGKKQSPYYCPIEIRLKHDLVKGIFSVSTPGKYDFMNAHRLRLYAEIGTGAGGVVVCSSAKLGRLCTARELIVQGEGALVVCVVKI